MEKIIWTDSLLRDWLLNQMQVVDKKLGAFLKEHGEQ